MPDTVGTSYIYMYLTRNYEIFPICAKDQYSKSDDKATNSIFPSITIKFSTPHVT